MKALPLVIILIISYKDVHQNCYTWTLLPIHELQSTHLNCITLTLGTHETMILSHRVPVIWKLSCLTLSNVGTFHCIRSCPIISLLISLQISSRKLWSLGCCQDCSRRFSFLNISFSHENSNFYSLATNPVHYFPSIPISFCSFSGKISAIQPGDCSPVTYHSNKTMFLKDQPAKLNTQQWLTALLSLPWCPHMLATPVLFHTYAYFAQMSRGGGTVTENQDPLNGFSMLPRHGLK